MDTVSGILSIISSSDQLMQYGMWYAISACVLAGGFTGIVIITLVQGLQGRAEDGTVSPMEFVAVGMIFLHAIVGGVLAQAFNYTQSFNATPFYSIGLLLMDVTLLLSYSIPERTSKAVVSSTWTTTLTVTISVGTLVSVM